MNFYEVQTLFSYQFYFKEISHVYCVKFGFTHLLSFAVLISLFETLCAICYYLYNLKNVKNSHGGLLVLVKLWAKAYNFTKTSIPPWVFFTCFELYKWYQITQTIIYISVLDVYRRVLFS